MNWGRGEERRNFCYINKFRIMNSIFKQRETYITDGLWLRQAETKHKILKHFNQAIRESGNINCRLNIDKFTSYFKILWNDTTCGTQNWNCSSKYDYEDKIQREELETILKKLKNGKPPGKEHSELYKYASEKF